MKAEEALQSSYDNYPDLFQTREEILNQLFCVIGNGYHWEDGELVDVCSEPDRIDLKYDLVDGKAYQRTPPTEVYTFLFNEYTAKKPRSERWYPISANYSAICNLPPDIKPDWLELAHECGRMLIEDGLITWDGDKYVPVRRETIGKAKEIQVPSTAGTET